MSFTVNEVGKPHNVNAAFDMSANTELSLVYTLPDLTSITKTSADGVILGTTLYTDPDTGQVFQPNEYVIYPVEAGFLSQPGEDTWNVYIIYDNAGTGEKYIGKCTTFTVLDTTCT